MRNIKNLILHNFQQWHKGNIEFKNGLNVITGDTECGKSTLIRAIQSILTGKMPEDYITKGKKDCNVKIIFSDNTVAEWERNNKENIISINNRKFERIGKEVPKEYFDILGKVNLEYGNEKKSLCISSQFDNHFFITDSDYDKNKILGAICGIDITDDIIYLINKDDREAKTNIKYIDSLLEELSLKLKNIVPVINNRISVQKKLEDLKIKFENSLKKSDILKNLKNNIEIIKTELENNLVKKEKYDNILNFYDINLKNIKLLENLQKIYHVCINIENEIYLINYQLLKCNKILQIDKKDNEKLIKLKTLFENQNIIKQEIECVNKKIDINNTYLKFSLINSQKIIRLKNIYDKILVLNNSNKDIQKNIEIINKEIIELESEKQDLFKNIKKCPLCGNIIE